MTRLLLLSVLLVVTGLIPANAEDIGTPLVDRKPIISSLGFSFVPPGGNNWYEKFGEDQINYYKKINPTTGSMFGGAKEYRTRTEFATPEEFRQWLSGRRNPKDASSRYRTTSAKYFLESKTGPFCVKYVEEYQDSGAKNLFGHPFLVVMNYGITCLHPQKPDSVVDIYYSYRHPPDNRSDSLMSEGESFVNSLKILEVKK